MALYETLPVYKDGYELMRFVYRACVHMERAYRFSLGERLQKEMTELLLNVYRANSVHEKVAHLRTARENILVVQLLFRVAHDENQVTMKRFIAASEKIESISKQLTAWEKSNRK
jgi:hypothetical protein